MSIRYQLNDWLYWNVDANYTLARSIAGVDGENYIPLAPEFSLVGGVGVSHPSGVFGNIEVRHLSDRPANEDRSILAEGYTVVDASVGYTLRRVELGIQIQNLFDVEWNETQFATESRLNKEPEPVEEIHFTPGTPFFARGSIAFNF